MLEKFAINILSQVAETCEERMNSFDTTEKKVSVYDDVSKNITDFVLELSRVEKDRD